MQSLAVRRCSPSTNFSEVGSKLDLGATRARARIAEPLLGDSQATRVRTAETFRSATGTVQGRSSTLLAITPTTAAVAAGD